MQIPKFFQNKLMKFGVPFMVLVVGGSFGLREFTELKFKYSNVTGYSLREKAKQEGLEMKKKGEITLESEFEKVKKLDIDNWDNIRGPRPWEGNYQNIPQRNKGT